jgi:hypothetical protein
MKPGRDARASLEALRWLAMPKRPGVVEQLVAIIGLNEMGEEVRGEPWTEREPGARARGRCRPHADRAPESARGAPWWVEAVGHRRNGSVRVAFASLQVCVGSSEYVTVHPKVAGWS